MTGYHGSWMQGLDLIQRAEPLPLGVFDRTPREGVSVIIDSIPRYNQANGRHMQRS
jgi:hypothetical protein